MLTEQVEIPLSHQLIAMGVSAVEDDAVKFFDIVKKFHDHGFKGRYYCTINYEPAQGIGELCNAGEFMLVLDMHHKLTNIHCFLSNNNLWLLMGQALNYLHEWEKKYVEKPKDSSRCQSCADLKIKLGIKTRELIDSADALEEAEQKIDELKIKLEEYER